MKEEINNTIFELGWDCGYNGPDNINCHYSIFSTPENTAEWERGKKEGQEAKKNKILTDCGLTNKESVC